MRTRDVFLINFDSQTPSPQNHGQKPLRITETIYRCSLIFRSLIYLKFRPTPLRSWLCTGTWGLKNRSFSFTINEAPQRLAWWRDGPFFWAWWRDGPFFWAWWRDGPFFWAWWRDDIFVGVKRDFGIFSCVMRDFGIFSRVMRDFGIFLRVIAW